MKCTRTCGLSFNAFTGVVGLLEIILSGLIAALSVYTWIKEGRPVRFIYEAGKSDNYVVRNTALESCVFVWCLAIVLLVCIWRIISAVLLFLCVKRDSAPLGQYWLLYKLLALIMSLFVAISSFNAPGIKIVAILSFVVDLVTSYFMFILHPEIGRMQRALIIKE